MSGVGLDVAFGSRQKRGGYAAALSGSTVPGLPAKVAQLLGRRGLWIGVVGFLSLARRRCVAGILEVTRRRLHKHEGKTLAVYGSASPAVAGNGLRRAPPRVWPGLRRGGGICRGGGGGAAGAVGRAFRSAGPRHFRSASRRAGGAGGSGTGVGVVNRG
jgi:hypothetical protein